MKETWEMFDYVLAREFHLFRTFRFEVKIFFFIKFWFEVKQNKWVRG